MNGHATDIESGNTSGCRHMRVTMALEEFTNAMAFS